MAKLTTEQEAIVATREAYRQEVIKKRYDKFFENREEEELDAVGAVETKITGAKALGLLAIAQRYPGLRVFFFRVGRFMMKRGLRGLDTMAESKELEKSVVKFSKPEASIYKSTLVKLGFPQLAMERGKVVGFLHKTAEVAQGVAKKPRVTYKISKTVKQSLSQHIDFLSEESFFQRAHKVAKQQNVFSRGEKARAFYHDYAAEYGVNYRSMQMLRTGGSRVSDVKLGRMYFFRYQAESTMSGRDMSTVASHKIYDAFPLIFLLAEVPGQIAGINFHYIEPKLRASLLGKMFMFLNNENFDNRTKLFAVKFRKVLTENRIFRHAKVSYKIYKPGRIQSKIIQVHPMDWELAIMVPTERFVTQTGGRVASKKIWFQSKRLARSA